MAKSRADHVVLLILLVLATGCLRSHPAPPLLRVGTSGDYPPFSAVRDGGFEGFDVEVARAFARESGRRLELVRFRWPELARDVAHGSFDLAMGGITMRPERVLAGHYSRPVVETTGMVLVRRGIARTPAELDQAGIRVAVNAGGHLERLARRLFPHATVLPVENDSLAPLLNAERVDALMTDDVEGEALRAVLPDAGVLGPLSRDRKAYLGRDPALVGELDRWLRAREADGTLSALRARWLGSARARPRSAFESDLDALVALIDLRLGLMPSVAAAKEGAGRPVEDAAQETRVREAVTRRAQEVGLEAESVAPLVEALIDAARTIQHAFLATPLDRRPAVEPLELEREARPALASLSDTIVARSADLASDQAALVRLDADTLAGTFDAAVPAPARAAIARALLLLRRTGPAVENQRL